MSENSGCSGGLLGIILVVVAIGVAIYAIVMLASVIAAVAGAGGVLWGGGTAIVNYGKSFKENIIDSNRAAA